MVRNYRKFYTPEKVAKFLIGLSDIQADQSICEPSFGEGSIIKSLLDLGVSINIFGYEIQSIPFINVSDWCYSRSDRIIIYRQDFLEVSNRESSFDRIIANPPFDEDKWISHIIKMYQCLKPNGIMTVIIPSYFITSYKCVSVILFINSFFRGNTIHLFDLKNWSSNKNGTTTEINILRVKKNPKI